MLTPEGFLLQIAASGEEALTIVAEQPPDLILLDVMMPGMDERNPFPFCYPQQKAPRLHRFRTRSRKDATEQALKSNRFTGCKVA